MTDQFFDTGHQAPLDLDAYGARAATSLYEAIQNATNSTVRSRQAQERRIGVSELGHCREATRRHMLDRAASDARDKTAAFVGTVLGDAIEAQMKVDHPDWLIQERVYFSLPSGGGVPGNADIIIPASAGGTREQVDAGERAFYQGVWDLKSKAELDSIRKFGPSQQQFFQVHAYAKGAIDAGHLDPTMGPIVVGLVYYDRSGRDTAPHGVFYEYSESVVDQIDEWVGDVVYAVQHGEEASRDMPRDWCHRFCEYASVCRTEEDSDVEGLIEDQDALNAVTMYREALDLEKEAKRLKSSAKSYLEGVSGSTGEFTVRSVEVGPTLIPEYTRAGYTKLDVRTVPKKKRK